MNIEEAIQNLIQISRMYGHKWQQESCEIAIKALEKQIPKKPKRYIAFDGIERNGCPTCPRNEILYAGQKYCSVCGQAINWEKEQKE